MKNKLAIVHAPGVRDHYWCGYVTIEGDRITIEKPLAIMYYAGGYIGRIAETGPQLGDRIGAGAAVGEPVIRYGVHLCHFVGVNADNWAPWVDERRTQGDT